MKPSISTKKKISVAIGTVIAALALGLLRFAIDDGAPTAAGKILPSSAGVGDKEPPPAGEIAAAATLQAPSSAIALTASARQEPAAKVADAFPGLPGRVTDWRGFRPDTLTVAPQPDLPITFTKVAVKDEGRYVTWFGRNPDLPGASFVGVATEKGYDGILVLPGASQFSFHVRGDTVVISESDPGEEGCGVEPAQHAKPPMPTGPGLVEVNYANGFAPRSELLAATPAIQVDVLFAYDAETLANAATRSNDPVGYIDGQCKAMIESANVALNQSAVTTFGWRHLGVVAAPAYTRTGKSLDDIQALAPNGALGEWVRTIRYQRGADQVMLLVGGSMDFGGRAYGTAQTPVTRNQAVAIMRWGSSFFLMAHELAHNFGCQHDRAHVEVLAPNEYGPPAPDNNGIWSYGQMWDNGPLPPGFTGSAGTGGTIMSYADWRIPYFSNPNISLRLTGSLLGWPSNPDLGMRQIGRPETDAKAAYNARVLSDHASAMSNIDEEVRQPAITQHPQNTTVTRGQTFTLSVTATGGGLSYQWLKAGVAISGATAATYTKVADAAEPDSYSVTVTNFVGTVTSSAASVTVTAPPPPPSSGGGGGGGAISPVFLALLCLVVLLRSIRSH